MIFIHDFLHGNLHPGNILVSPEAEGWSSFSLGKKLFWALLKITFGELKMDEEVVEKGGTPWNFSDGGNREFGEMRTPPGWMAANCHKNHGLVVLKGEKESFFQERRKKRSGRKEEFFIAFVRRKITRVHQSFKGFEDKLKAEQLECRLPDSKVIGMGFEEFSRSMRESEAMVKLRIHRFREKLDKGGKNKIFREEKRRKQKGKRWLILGVWIVFGREYNLSKAKQYCLERVFQLKIQVIGPVSVPVEVGGETGDSEAPMLVVEEFFEKEFYILTEKQSFGGRLLDKNGITLSFVPNDEHAVQIRFALERVLAILVVIETQKLVYANDVCDFVRYARFKSTLPAYHKDEKDQYVWNAVFNVTKSMS
ncbi:hypothetical protein VitviT2T_011659 [Vitis vinifera]|uniref:Protein kinase domain-containing protein n=1 Tax=Vitis vinifera TaxID=29760 RepID=A0ABY9CER6_VITVI|nr:hypothetical protein VitviT2T_011659 [Vitis vinifera]